MAPQFDGPVNKIGCRKLSTPKIVAGPEREKGGNFSPKMNQKCEKIAFLPNF